MKKILFTVQWYNIDPTISNSANTICDENIITELKKNPLLEIHTLSYGVDGYPLEEYKDGVYIHRFKRSWLWRKLITGCKKSDKRLYGVLFLVNRILMRIKQLVTIPIYPIYEPIHLWNFARKAYKLHQSEHFDAVVSVHYGSDSLCAGYYLKKKCSELKYIAICWDSIAGSNLVKYLPKQYAIHKKRRFERKIASMTNGMIVMEASREYHMNNPLAASYLDKLIYLDVPYYCPDSSSTVIETQRVENPLRVLFSGNMVGRNPLYLFSLFNKYSVPVIFTFVCHDKFHHNLYQCGENFANVKVKCMSYMSHDDLRKVQLENDILINFGVTNPSAISGKIFDYISTGKIVLSTTTIDNEACIKYLKKYPKGIIIDERLSIEKNLNILSEFLKNISSVNLSFSELDELFSTSKPESYKKTIEQIIGDIE